MELTVIKNIILYKPLPKAQRFKIYIPYELHHERRLFKTLNSTFYHPQQKLWSIINSNDNWQLVHELFKDKLTITDSKPNIALPKVILNENALNALAEVEKTMVLKAFANSTVKTYRSELVHFFKFFEKRNYLEITKGEIENYLFILIKRYNISTTKQNQIINAIKCYYEHVLGKDRTFYILNADGISDFKLAEIFSLSRQNFPV